MEFDSRLLKEEQYADTDLDSVDNEAGISKPFGRPSWISRFLHSPFSLHLLLLVSYTVCFIWLAKSYPRAGCAQRDMIYCKSALDNARKGLGELTSFCATAPAREALEYETQIFKSSLDENPFLGPPRPELDAAWHDLLKSTLVAFNRDL